jgi:predicted porin
MGAHHFFLAMTTTDMLYYNCKKGNTATYDNRRRKNQMTEYQMEQFEGLDTDAIYQIFGGKSNRGSTSKAIRTLLGLGYKRGRVATMLNIRYQHVRNVELEPVKRTAE